MRDMIRPTLVLFVICLIVGGALAFTNAATSEKIQQRIVEESEKARKSVMPDADNFEGINMEKILKADGADRYSTVKEAYVAKKGGNAVGYVFLTVPDGYAGPVNVMVGIDLKGFVSGVEIGDNKETPGLGSKAKDPGFRNQYNNKLFDEIHVVKGKAQGDDEIQAISGATITSKAVSMGVLQASQLAAALIENELEVN